MCRSNARMRAYRLQIRRGGLQQLLVSLCHASVSAMALAKASASNVKGQPKGYYQRLAAEHAPAITEWIAEFEDESDAIMGFGA